MRLATIPSIVAASTACAATLAGLALLGGGANTDALQRAPHAARTAADANYGRLPLAFEANGGRTDSRVDYLARGRGYTLFLTPGESVLALGAGRHSGVVRSRLVGAAKARGRAEARLPGKVNYFVGKRSNWRTGINTYRRVRYRSIYPGIDLLYYGHTGQLEYDFRVHPRGDPAKIRLEFEGAVRPRLDGRGNLILSMQSGGSLQQLRPRAYQTLADGSRQPVSARYVISGRRVTMRLGHYDHSRLLTIDPTLGYSTYVGGGQADDAMGLVLDSNDDAYITGSTQSSTFPVVSAYRSTPSGTDAFVTELNPSGSAVLYSTFFGGNGDDIAKAIALDSSGNVYIGGSTGSSDFPNTRSRQICSVGGCPTPNGAQDGFAAKISAGGASLGWSMYIGGSSTDIVTGLAVDGSGDVDVVGRTDATGANTDDFPTMNAAQSNFGGGSSDAFIAKLHYFTCSGIHCTTTCCGIDYAYASYFGGPGADDARGMALGTTDAWFVGSATDKVPKDGSLTLTSAPVGTDAYVARFDLSKTGSASLMLGALFGKDGYDAANGISLTQNQPTIIGDPCSCTAHIVGETTSSTLPSGTSSTVSGLSGESDGFVTDLSSDAPTSWANTAYLGGAGNDYARAIQTVSRSGFTTTGCGGSAHFCFRTIITEYIVGDEQSDNFAGTKLGESSTLTDIDKDRQAFVWKREPGSAAAAIWKAWIGGSALPADGEFGEAVAVDADGRTYIAGKAGDQFPTTSGAYQPVYGKLDDAFVARIDIAPPVITSGPTSTWQNDGDVIGTNAVAFDFTHNEPGGGFACSGETNGVLDNTNRQGCEPPMSYGGLADGPQTFGLSTFDTGGTQSAQTTRSFIVDTQPPAGFDLIAPDDGAVTGTTPTFSWHAAVDASTKVSYQVMAENKPVASLGVDGCRADGTCSVQATDAIPTGSHPWFVRATDQANHSTDSATRMIVVQDPPVARFSIAPNPALAGRTVTFDASASNDPTHTITHYEWDLDGDGTFESDAGTAATVTKAYSKPQSVPITLRVTDGSGLTSVSAQNLTVSGLATSDLLGVTINNGAQYTRTPDVTVTANFPKGTTQMLFSNDGGFLKPSIFQPQKETAWKLDSSGPERLPKTIYVRFFTGPIASETFQDDIILDEIPPVVQSAAIEPAAGSSSAASTARLRSWKIKVKAKDSNSGVKGVQVTANQKKPGKLIPYKRRVKTKLTTRPKWIRARDKAGNNSRWRKLK